MIIPTFSEAVIKFKDFLSSQSLPVDIFWVFREDIHQTSLKKIYIHMPIPKDRPLLANRAFDLGRDKNLVRIDAICLLGTSTVATVWYPRDTNEIPQGWEEGFRLGIRDPLYPALTLSGLRWKAITNLTNYRKSQHIPHQMLLSILDIVQQTPSGNPAPPSS